MGWRKSRQCVWKYTQAEGIKCGVKRAVTASLAESSKRILNIYVYGGLRFRYRSASKDNVIGMHRRSMNERKTLDRPGNARSVVLGRGPESNGNGRRVGVFGVNHFALDGTAPDRHEPAGKRNPAMTKPEDYVGDKAPRCPGCGRYMQQDVEKERLIVYECCTTKTKFRTEFRRIDHDVRYT